MTPLLAVEGLGLRFGAVTALSDVSFTVDAGERVALLGPNGAGKTSVLNCISGVERPSAGRIELRGRDLAGVRTVRRAGLGVARTLQGLGVVDSLDVLGNLLLGRHSSRSRGGRDKRVCEGVAEALGLVPVLRTPAGALGAGARKRLELGRALASEAELLLLDEPFAGVGDQDIALMVAAVKRAPSAALIVDHRRDVVLALVRRTVTLDGGRVVVPA